MNRFVRYTLMFYAFSLSLMSVLLIIVVVNRSVFEALFVLLNDLFAKGNYKWIFIIFAIFLFIFSLAILVYGIQSGRLHTTRVRTNEIGSIDIGADAIENIILNTAKMSQSGIKSSKARVYSVRGGKIKVHLTAMLYSDVEIPAMMAKVQNKVKKDIERYTGIPVSEVIVKVSRVENIQTRVER